MVRLSDCPMVIRSISFSCNLLCLFTLTPYFGPPQTTDTGFLTVCTCISIASRVIACVTLVLYSVVLLDRLKRRREDWKPEKRRWNSRDYIKRRELEEHWREPRLSLRKRYAYFMYSLFYFHLLFIWSTDVVMHAMSTLWKSGYMTFATAEIWKVEMCMYIEMLFYL